MEKDKNNRFTILCIIIILFIVTSTIAGIRNAENQCDMKFTASELDSFVKIKAKDYIKNKYGFDAEIVEYNRKCPVTMKHEDKKFYVLVDGFDNKAICSDSYQAEKIQMAVEESMGDIFKGYSVCEITAGGIQATNYMAGAADIYSKDNQENDRLYHEIFNGDNLNEVLSKDSIYVCCCCVKKDISGNDIPEKLRKALPGIMIKVDMYSYNTIKQAASKDKEHYREKHSVTIRRNGEIGKDEYLKYYSNEE